MGCPYAPPTGRLRAETGDRAGAPTRWVAPGSDLRRPRATPLATPDPAPAPGVAVASSSAASAAVRSPSRRRRRRAVVFVLGLLVVCAAMVGRRGSRSSIDFRLGRRVDSGGSPSRAIVSRPHCPDRRAVRRPRSASSRSPMPAPWLRRVDPRRPHRASGDRGVSRRPRAGRARSTAPVDRCPGRSSSRARPRDVGHAVRDEHRTSSRSLPPRCRDRSTTSRRWPPSRWSGRRRLAAGGGGAGRPPRRRGRAIEYRAESYGFVQFYILEGDSSGR